MEKNKFLYKFHESFEEAKYWDQILQKLIKRKLIHGIIIF